MAGMLEVNLDTDFESLSDETGVEVDETQMRRVVHNLVINAMQASSRGQGKVSVRGAVTGNTLTLAVTDNGTGIPADRLPLIFEPYYTTKDDGTGLGLAISKRIAEEHAGTIVAESEVGRGSTFTVRLPAKTAVR